ncbi:MAG TPA: thymidine kinase [Bacteroidales bacterium]|jgi:thymidine kinase|nr:thymidine kinase [Bacteroidales bacterium]OQB60711.1 MAG: Thymidine kinase [Bacteroidetes bacterium ADurb.Bin145]HOU01412.1 thymidine kinase [Bacteroidales bacterium]HQG62085.1 thymidine kinase [Bacteroidales bacterium]HQK68040.1 thymidine kinase [Bacteroidales bacterium]
MEFLENSVRAAGRRGSVEVITGSMFSGKTEELIRRLRRAQFAGLKVEIFKPSIDKRYSEIRVVSHDEKSIVSTPVENSSSILLLSGDVDVIGIDEAQFFDNAIVEVCNKLADKGIRVIVAGLDMDFMGKPFGPMPGLLSVAEYVTKVHAICMRCGNLAQYSFRKTDEEQVVVLGEKEKYEPLCRHCYNKAMGKKH